MKRLIPLLVVSMLLICGCSSVKVVPQPVENGRVNQADNSISIAGKGVELSVRADQNSLNSYNLDSPVSAFHLTIANTGSSEVAYGEDSFVLVDEAGLQYALLTPEKVREMLKKDSYYLMPYPYVGFYYLEDFQKTSFYNRFNSSLPYYYELYPQDLYTSSLPLTGIIPGMKVAGLVFFKIDVSRHTAVKLLVFRKGAAKSAAPDFTVPFTIVK